MAKLTKGAPEFSLLYTSCDCSITMATIIYSVNSSRDRYLLPAGSTLGLEFLEEFRDTPVRSQRHLLVVLNSYWICGFTFTKGLR